MLLYKYGLNLVNYPGLFLKERIAQDALQARLEPSKVPWAIFHILAHKPKIQT